MSVTWIPGVPLTARGSLVLLLLDWKREIKLAKALATLTLTLQEVVYYFYRSLILTNSCFEACTRSRNVSLIQFGSETFENEFATFTI